MRINRASLLLAGVLALGLAGCSQSLEDQVKNQAQYWQRAQVTEGTWLEGPKAQQLLHRNIANCVVEIRELETLGALRTNIPADSTGYGKAPDPDTPAGELAEWETPEREGYLRAEHLPYHDFETCMIYNGWERVEHLPYDLADRSRREYLETLTGESYRSRTRERQSPIIEPEGDWENLND